MGASQASNVGASSTNLGAGAPKMSAMERLAATRASRVYPASGYRASERPAASSTSSSATSASHVAGGSSGARDRTRSDFEYGALPGATASAGTAKRSHPPS